MDYFTNFLIYFFAPSNQAGLSHLLLDLSVFVEYYQLKTSSSIPEEMLALRQQL